MRVLIAAACIVMLSAAPVAADGLNPPQKIIDRCEKDYQYIAAGEYPKPIPEVGRRYFAITFADCEELGVFTKRQIRVIEGSEVGDYFRAYKANPQIWG